MSDKLNRRTILAGAALFPLSRFRRPVLRQRLRPLPNQIRCSLRWQPIARPLWST